ncbi:hypothetical protein BJV82DRAFT_645005 [Fennellomyces sp. T-0311]|nr:hypothetical protein BJV82DRAFT_645005 [Fennellomyces sp. T-0311]
MNTRRFAPDKQLLNAKFEGYKLTPLDEQERVTRVKLPNECDLKIHKILPNHRMGFRDLQARVRFNHLAYGFPLSNNEGCAFYVDPEYQVIRVRYSKDTKDTQFQPIVQLIQPLGNLPNYTEPCATVPTDPQAPSLITLNDELLLSSNGAGNIELVHIDSGAVIGSTRYEGDGTEGISPVPCVLLAARLVGDKVVMVVYSRVGSKATRFNIAALEMTLVGQLSVLHIQRGSEVPPYCSVSKDGKLFVYGSESPYEAVAPAQDTDMEDAPELPAESPPYQWTQDDADITAQWTLQPSTPKSDISCQINSTHISLVVRGQDVSYPFRKLWSTLNADESTWTLESDGTLTLFLSKQDENTRWPHLFDIDDGVLETLDPAKLAEITERLEKFTATAGNEPSVQNPVATDMDEDIDDRGEPVRFAVYNRDGQHVETIHSGGHEWLCGPFDSKYHKALPSACVKVDVDGQVYTLEEDGDVIEPKHVATFDAFAFVQASKRDSRFVRYDPQYKFITIIESSRNAYIYYRHGDKRTLEAQTLVDLTRGHDIDVLGCQLVLDNVLMVLTESEVITILV